MITDYRPGVAGFHDLYSHRVLTTLEISGFFFFLYRLFCKQGHFPDDRRFLYIYFGTDSCVVLMRNIREYGVVLEVQDCKRIFPEN
jgi:hypothetical protein